jgi:nitroreductase
MKPFDLQDVDRLLTTTKAVRRRLDLTRPVEREVILDCIRLAAYAPNASNGQEWKWIVVDDPELRRRCAEQYRKLTVPPVSRMLEAKLAEGDEAGARISRSIIYLAEHMAEVPALVFPCYDRAAADGRYQRLLHQSQGPTMTSAMYASIYPAVWSFQLALRSRGLGSVLTTAHQSDQATMADILGIPTTWDQTSMIPVAYTTGDDFSPSPRQPVGEAVIFNRAGA